MKVDKALSDIVSDMLDRDISEVKNILATMSIKDLVTIIHSIDDYDKETVFKIYSGYAV